MSVYNKRGILLLPKVIVLNPKDGAATAIDDRSVGTQDRNGGKTTEIPCSMGIKKIKIVVDECGILLYNGEDV